MCAVPPRHRPRSTNSADDRWCWGRTEVVGWDSPDLDPDLQKLISLVRVCWGSLADRVGRVQELTIDDPKRRVAETRDIRIILEVQYVSDVGNRRILVTFDEGKRWSFIVEARTVTSILPLIDLYVRVRWHCGKRVLHPIHGPPREPV